MGKVLQGDTQEAREMGRGERKMTEMGCGGLQGMGQDSWMYRRGTQAMLIVEEDNRGAEKKSGWMIEGGWKWWYVRQQRAGEGVRGFGHVRQTRRKGGKSESLQ